MRSAVPARWIESLETRSLMATIAVTTLADSGAGSLRAAIASAVNGDMVDLGGLTGTLTLNTAIAVSKRLDIVGPGPDQLTLAGVNHGSRAFDVTFSYSGNTSVRLSHLAITNFGSTQYGGAINATGGGTLSLLDVKLTNNTAGGAGGAIYTNAGTTLGMIDCTVSGNVVGNNGYSAMGGGVAMETGSFVFKNCTFSNNTASGMANDLGGNLSRDVGGAFGGGFSAANIALGQMHNCTFAGNSVIATSSGNHPSDAQASGGGAYIRLGTSLGITQCTFARNEVTDDPTSTNQGAGGGLFVSRYDPTKPASQVTMINTLIAANSADTRADASLSDLAAVSHNVISDGTGSGIANGVAGCIIGTTAQPVNAKISGLADNGGPTQTIALTAGSPAVDKGDTQYNWPIDQRGYSRFHAPDIGAFEYRGMAPSGVVPVTFAGGRLTIQGTTDADEVRLFSPKGRADTVRVAIGAGSWNFSRSGITAVEIYGDDGDDTIGLSTDLNVFVNGGTGNDAIAGGSGNDTIEGDEGSDRIDGGAGDDLLTGNAGNDRVNGGDGNDRVYGNAGNDQLSGDAGRDRIDAGDGRDLLYALDRAHDTLYGDSADAGYLDDTDVRSGNFALLA